MLFHFSAIFIVASLTLLLSQLQLGNAGQIRINKMFSIQIRTVRQQTAHQEAKYQQSPSGEKLAAQNSQFLIGQTYKGNYQSLQQTSLFQYLDTKQGEIQSLFYSDPLKVSSAELNSLQIFLFNPKYHDLKAVGILIDLDQIKQGGKWAQNNSKIKIQKFWKGRSYEDEETIQNVSYIIQIVNIDSQDSSKVAINLSIDGPTFKFTAQLTYYHDILSTLGYSFYTTAIVCLQIFCAIKILQQIDRENPALISKISLLTLSICNIEDFYFTMLHIEYIMSSGTAYLFFVLPSIAYLILFVIFDMKMLFLVWRSHHLRVIENAQALRKKLTVFYIEFYLGLFIYLTLNYFFEYESWLIFIQHVVLIPQIVHNVRKGNNPGFPVYYILGFLGLRFLIPLYERGCPGNHFSLQPMPVLITMLGILYAVSILILFLQSKYGPRFFVPKFLLPNYYNYNVKLRLTQQNKEIECTICLLNIFEPQIQANNNSSVAINQSTIQNYENLLQQINVLKTPCNHYFHKGCLSQWIDVKLQCPTCRKALPAMD